MGVGREWKEEGGGRRREVERGEGEGGEGGRGGREGEGRSKFGLSFIKSVSGGMHHALMSSPMLTPPRS